MLGDQNGRLEAKVSLFEKGSITNTELSYYAKAEYKSKIFCQHGLDFLSGLTPTKKNSGKYIIVVAILKYPITLA